jgi:hypothetical protein
MALEVVGAVPEARRAELADYTRGHRLTEHLVRAALDAGLDIEAAVQMDEFTFDLVIALPDGLWLVYDTT